jgi:putative glutathione S-transferase
MPEEITNSQSNTQHMSAAVRRILGSKGKPQGSAVSGKKGEYIRKVSSFHSTITADGTGDFPAEKDRYHIYYQAACPWSHRVLMILYMKGLTECISVTNLDHLLTSDGWRFTEERPDPLYGKRYLRELYGYSLSNEDKNKTDTADWDSSSEFTGRVTVPVLWDKKTETIVNNESSEIIRMLNFEFNEWAENPDLDLYPEDLRDEIEKVNEWVYEYVNDGVYRTGFSETQEAYDFAVKRVFEGLDRMEDILQKKRFLTGDRFTEADLRAFNTLIRFDAVYAIHFKCSLRRIRDYPAILGYTREIYQMPNAKESVDFTDIRNHYYDSHRHLNKFGIVPAFENVYNEPHGRDNL